MSGTIDRVLATRAIDDTPLLQLQPPRAPTATVAASRWAPRNISLECVFGIFLPVRLRMNEAKQHQRALEQQPTATTMELRPRNTTQAPPTKPTSGSESGPGGLSATPIAFSCLRAAPSWLSRLFDQSIIQSIKQAIHHHRQNHCPSRSPPRVSEGRCRGADGQRQM